MNKLLKILMPLMGLSFGLQSGLNAQSIDSTKYTLYGLEKDSIIVKEYSKGNFSRYKFIDVNDEGHYEFISGSNLKEGREIEENQSGNYVFSIVGIPPGEYVYDSKGFLIRTKFK